MRAYNHLWQINRYIFKEVGYPVGIVDDYLHLQRNGVEYRIKLAWVALYVPLNKYYIRMDKVSKYLERV